LLTRHASALKALRTGRNNFGFERLSDLDRLALKALIAEAAAVFINGYYGIAVRASPTLV